MAGMIAAGRIGLRAANVMGYVVAKCTAATLLASPLFLRLVRSIPLFGKVRRHPASHAWVRPPLGNIVVIGAADQSA